MVRKKAKGKGETENQEDGNRSSSSSGTRRKPKKEKEKDLIDFAIQDLVFNIAENDNSNLSRKERFRQVALVEYMQKNVESMYPNIGRETYRVPDVYINKRKEGEVSDEGIHDFIRPEDTDVRSDRAHSFVSDMIYHLSSCLKKTTVGPFFIISSFEYDNFLSRLKSSFEEKMCPQDIDVNFPKGSGHERGEIDILIVLPKHVIFVEIKAIGDNFHEYVGDKISTVTKNIKKAINQLVRDEKVFDHVMADLNLQCFRRTKVVAFPNLEREYLKDALKDGNITEKSHDIKFLCKEDMPKNRLTFQEDFHVFMKWWIKNVFTEIQHEELLSVVMTTPGFNEGTNVLDENVLSGSERIVESKNEIMQQSLDEIKVIVGRYVGFMSVVKVCNNSNSKLHRIEGRMEGRRKGQLVWYVGEKFANIILTPDQKKYLDADIRLGYLCGPPGSGKTVVLTLRARRWILHDDNFVVVVNMYRGAPGRAIGKQIFKTITENSDKNKEKYLREHTMEVGVDVSCSKFSREKFVTTIEKRWGADIGDQGQRIMFIVDETYVQSYWNDLFKTLRQEFANSAMWCAGLYGKQPDKFTSLELTKVIRSPPNVQLVLSLIDWVEDRKKCYITDSTTAYLPTNGPQVLTVQHQKHTEYANEPQSHCPMCGSDLAQILKLLHVKVPHQGHSDPDLQLCSLQCSEIVLLVNMPRELYSPDDSGYLDTTVDKYQNYMMRFKDCPLLTKINEAGYPTRVHTDLTCGDLISSPELDVINVTWIYTYQGLENKVIVFIPGDMAMPENSQDKFLTDPSFNIPCPGLLGSEDDKNKTPDDGITERMSSRVNSECDSVSGEDGDSSTDGDLSDSCDIPECDRQRTQTEADSREDCSQQCEHNWCTCGTDESKEAGAECVEKSRSCLQNVVTDCPQIIIEEHIFNLSDLNRYTRWDKSNLFISASRCTSQLILITR